MNSVNINVTINLERDAIHRQKNKNNFFTNKIILTAKK